MKRLRGLEGSKEFWFVIFTSFFFFLLRLPSLFEPLWYGDEGIYQVIGTSLNNGKLLYAEIFDNKPPLLYWLYAIFNSDQIATRLASLIFGILSVVVFFALSKKLFGESKSKLHFLTTFIFAVLFGLPTFEGNIANAENFMLLPIILAAFFIFKNGDSRSKLSTLNFQLSTFTAGFLLGIAFLFKIVAIFDFAAFLIFYGVINFESLRKYLKFPSIIKGFILPIAFVTLFFILNGTVTEFIQAVFLSNISYVSYGNKIGSLPTILFIKLILLGIASYYLFAKRKEFSKATLFVLFWFIFSLFNAFFSQRPYIHYLLVVIPSFSLLIGLIFFDKKYRKITIIFLLIGLFAIIKLFGFPGIGKIIPYYQNFISFVSGQKSMVSFQAFFDKDTPFDYEIARFIRPKIEKGDTIFVWGNNAQLYQLVNVVAPTKYVVAYHITNYKDGIENTKNTIEKIKPKFIVAVASERAIPFPLVNYSKKINIGKALIYERIF